MTTTLGTNANNDIFLDPQENITLLTGQAACLAACATAAKAQLGEMVLAINQGIPNFQAIWTGVPNLAIWQAYLRRTLEGVDGVIAVTELTTQQIGNTFTYTATIETEFGEIALNG